MSDSFLAWIDQTEHYLPLTVLLTVFAALWSGGNKWGVTRSQLLKHAERLDEHSRRVTRLEDILPNLLTREEFAASDRSIHTQLTAIMSALIKRGA
jgi:hypothetical protein